MRYIRCLLAGLAAGAASAAVWAAIVHFTGYEYAWVTIGIGLVVGAAVVVTAGGRGDAQTGGLAAAVALLAVAGGRYAAAHFAVATTIDGMVAEAMEVTDDEVIGMFADDIVATRGQQGEVLEWPMGVSAETVRHAVDYPPGIWEEAAREWRAMPVEEQEAFRAGWADTLRALAPMMETGIRDDAFANSFDAFGVVCGLFAVGAAWIVGAARPQTGGTGCGEEEAGDEEEGEGATPVCDSEVGEAAQDGMESERRL